MIVKRIRKGHRQLRGTVARLVESVKTLSAYVVDALPWPSQDLDRVRSLTDYTMDVEGTGQGEKVEAFGAFNLRGDKLEEWQMEMAAVATLAPRSRDPLEHFVVSWQEGEQPTAKQVEEAARILLKVLGYDNCPAIWSCHTNTENWHLHLAVVRIDPATKRVAGDGWDLDRCHQAMSLIEEQQDWQAEPHALYVARDGEVFDRATGNLVRNRAGEQVGRRKSKPLPPKLAEAAIDIRQSISVATDWFDLHDRLAEIGAYYRRKGSGGVIAIAETEVKASQIHPSCSLTRLERKLGAFEEDIRDGNDGYEAYLHSYREQLGHIRAVHARERTRLCAWYDQIQAQSEGEHGSGSGLRAESDLALEAVDAAFRLSKIALSNAKLSAHQWRSGKHPTQLSRIPLPTLLLPHAPHPTNSGGTVSTVDRRDGEWQIDYWDPAGNRTFSDRRGVIIVHQLKPASMDAALLRAAARWGAVRVVANHDNSQRIAERAAKLGITVVNSAGLPLTPATPPAPLSPQTHTSKPAIVAEAPSGIGTSAASGPAEASNPQVSQRRKEESNAPFATRYYPAPRRNGLRPPRRLADLRVVRPRAVADRPRQAEGALPAPARDDRRRGPAARQQMPGLPEGAGVAGQQLLTGEVNISARDPSHTPRPSIEGAAAQSPSSASPPAQDTTMQEIEILAALQKGKGAGR